MADGDNALLLDEPSDIDLLSFDAVAGTIVEAVLDPTFDSIALGLSGSWGSGKTSILRLIAAQLRPAEGDSTRTIVIETDPWRYDPQLGIKESLIGEILVALELAIPDDPPGNRAKELLRRLAKRVDWGKALRLAAKSAITVSVPSFDQVFDLVRPKQEIEDAPEPITDMVRFKAEFADLLTSDGLNSITHIVVLVDDLDRCLPDTVVETLETIRLFLSVPKMSFVIAADEERVADAIGKHYPNHPTGDSGDETPARLYLHKIVQTSVPVPALSDFDTEAYLVLLQIRRLVTSEEYEPIVEAVATARYNGTQLEDIPLLQRPEFTEVRNGASRIKPIIHEKAIGNPRRIKRFLNDLSVRIGIADRRNIKLDTATIAKLMVLEQYFANDFKELLGWLSSQTLRANLKALERQAGTPDEDAPEPVSTEESALPPAKTTVKKVAAKPEPKAATPAELPKFGPGMIRWARLSPPLAEKDLAPYLVFAASFRNVYLASEGLPEAIRDIASRLLSKSAGEARRVTDPILQGLQPSEATRLASYIGGVMVDEPQRQTSGVVALLRIGRLRVDAVESVVSALTRIDPKDFKIGGAMALKPTDPPKVFAQIEALAKASGDGDIVRAIELTREDA